MRTHTTRTVLKWRTPSFFTEVCRELAAGEDEMAKCFCHELEHLDGVVFLDPLFMAFLFHLCITFTVLIRLVVG